MNTILRLATLCVVLLLNAGAFAQSQSAFTYQGRLKLGGVPVTNTCDFRVSLWNAQSAGTQLAGPMDILNVSVDKGLFVITPDFGFDIWDGDARFIQIAVRSPAGGGPYTTLAPRQAVTAVPYALFAQQGGEWTFESPSLFYLGGKVGIGTSGPDASLHVVGSGGGQNVAHFHQPTGVNFIDLTSANGGGNYGTVLRFIDGGVHSAQIATTANGNLLFTTGSQDTVRLSIDPTGHAAMGGATPDSSALKLGSPSGVSLTVEGQIRSVGDCTVQSGGSSSLFLNPFANAVVIGGLGGTGPTIVYGKLGVGRDPTNYPLEVEGHAGKTQGGGTWQTVSDARAKAGVASISDALATLRRVRAVSFRYADWYRAEHPTIGTQTEFNVLAQEFREVFPDHVHDSGMRTPDGSALLSVDTSPLIPYSVAAIQELDRKNIELEANVARQSEEIAELKARLARIEAHLAGQMAGQTATPSR